MRSSPSRRTSAFVFTLRAQGFVATAKLPLCQSIVPAPTQAVLILTINSGTGLPFTTVAKQFRASPVRTIPSQVSTIVLQSSPGVALPARVSISAWIASGDAERNNHGARRCSCAAESRNQAHSEDVARATLALRTADCLLVVAGGDLRQARNASASKRLAQSRVFNSRQPGDLGRTTAIGKKPGAFRALLRRHDRRPRPLVFTKKRSWAVFPVLRFPVHQRAMRYVQRRLFQVARPHMPVFHQTGQREALAFPVPRRVAEIIVSAQKIGDRAVLFQNAQPCGDLLGPVGKAGQKGLPVHRCSSRKPGPTVLPRNATLRLKYVPIILPGNNAQAWARSGCLELGLEFADRHARVAGDAGQKSFEPGVGGAARFRFVRHGHRHFARPSSFLSNQSLPAFAIAWAMQA